MTLFFAELPIGTEFEFFGGRHRKTWRSIAKDEGGLGWLFMDETVVSVEQEPSERLPYALNLIHWTSWLTPAPRALAGRATGVSKWDKHLAQPELKWEGDEWSWWRECQRGLISCRSGGRIQPNVAPGRD